MENNLDPISFLNSRDIRKHLCDIGFKPDILQSAFFIYQSKLRTIIDKHLAWQELCETTEDIILTEEVNWRWEKSFVHGMSAHNLIQEHMCQEDEWLDYYYQKDPLAVYYPTYVLKPKFDRNSQDCCYDKRDDGGLFASFEAAQAQAIKVIKDDLEEEIATYSIRKQFINEDIADYNQYIIVIFNRNHEAMAINTFGFDLEAEAHRTNTLRHPDFIIELVAKHDELPIDIEFFENMWFDIPIPFKKGDIVLGAPMNWMSGGEPFVLLNTVPSVLKERNANKRFNNEGHDSSDMNANGWSIGFYEDCTRIKDDVMADYLDLEYYRGDFKGPQRLLPIMAAFEKGDIDAWLYHRFTEAIINESKVGGEIAEKAKGWGVGSTIIQILEGKPVYEDE